MALTGTPFIIPDVPPGDEQQPGTIIGALSVIAEAEVIHPDGTAE